MHQVVIVEDDADQAEALAWMVDRFPRGRECAIACLSSVAELDEFLREQGRVDILLMDIKLGENGPDGIDAVQKLFPAGSRTQVVYVTGHVEYCTRVYRTEHIYFLTKPLKQTDLDDALAKAFENLALTERQIPVRASGTVVLVAPSSIDYVESDRRKVRIHRGSSELETYGPLSKLADELPSNFLQCHKSFLVNMDRIIELQGNSVRLDSGATVPVSQKRRKAVRDALLRHMAGRL